MSVPRLAAGSRRVAACLVATLVATCATPATGAPNVAGLARATARPADDAPAVVPSPVFLRRASGLALDTGDALAVRVVAEFGAVFVAGGGAVRPASWMFPDEEAVSAFQGGVRIGTARSASLAELQEAATAALEAAVAEARSHGLALTLNGPGSARRTYAETVRLWKSRLEPGLAHWVRAGALSRAEADRVLALPPPEQIRAALALEARGRWLSTRFDKSILQSVAAPGTSQHLSLLAIDVAQHANPEVRAILARHGWYQTVYSDLPHFTYVGVPERELPALGLVPRENAGRTFWVVDVPRVRGAPEPDVMDECPF